MRIFTLDNIITCVLLDNSSPDPQHIKKPHYQLKIFPYCKNDSKYISLDSVQKILTNMNVLCLDSIIEPDKINLAKTIKTKPFAKIEREAIAQMKKRELIN